MRSRPHVPALPLCLLAAALAGGCWTEDVSSKPGLPNLNRQPGGGVGVPLPPGPIGTNAQPGSTLSVRAMAALRPLGSINYDGLTLPLITPDGSLIITAAGQMPSWDAVLAGPNAAPPLGTVIEAWQITTSPPAPGAASGASGAMGLTKVTWDPSATAGLLLGRSCSVRHVLVERPNADGTRSIGLLPLGPEGGNIEWLADENGPVSGWGAIRLRDGTMVFSVRPPALDGEGAGNRSADLVVRTPQGQNRVLHYPGSALVWPIATPDQQAIGVFAAGDHAELLVVSATQAAPDGSPRIIARQPFDAPMSETGAYQAAAPVEACPIPASSSVPGAPDLNSTLLFVHPVTHRIACFNTREGRISMLPGAAAGASRVATAELQGFLISGPKSIDFFPLGALSMRSGIAPTSRLIEGAYVSRAIEPGPAGDFVVIGPDSAASGARLSVLRMRLMTPGPQGRPTP